MICGYDLSFLEEDSIYTSLNSRRLTRSSKELLSNKKKEELEILESFYKFSKDNIAQRYTDLELLDKNDLDKSNAHK